MAIYNNNSPYQIKKKKATRNRKNKDHKCFRHVIAVALKYKEIEMRPEKVSNTNSFINKYRRKEINYLSRINNWKTFQKNNPTISDNIFHLLKKKKDAQFILNSKNPIILLMILNKNVMLVSCGEKTICIIKENN